MKKEMLSICRIEGDTLYYGKFYEVSELGKAKTEANRLMKKTGDDYRIYICAVNIDGLFQGIAQIGGYWEKYFGDTWRYNSTPKYQDAYEGMEVEARVMTTTDGNGTIEFGKIIDAENLIVKFEDGRVLDFNNNPWASDNKTYFHFIGDIYPVPVAYRLEKQVYSYDADGVLPGQRTDHHSYGVCETAEQKHNEFQKSFEAQVAKDGYGSVTPLDNGFKYVVEKDGVTSVEIHKFGANNWSERRF